VAGDAEAETVADETERWIEAHLGPSYPWPGNVRELEQCVRNVMIRGEYRPPRVAADTRARLVDSIVAGSLSADELLRRYCTLVYAQTGSYQETGRRLGPDRRTVRERSTRRCWPISGARDLVPRTVARRLGCRPSTSIGRCPSRTA
jgi:hypothetical protein